MFTEVSGHTHGVVCVFIVCVTDSRCCLLPLLGPGQPLPGVWWRWGQARPCLAQPPREEGPPGGDEGGASQGHQRCTQGERERELPVPTVIIVSLCSFLQRRLQTQIEEIR